MPDGNQLRAFEQCPSWCVADHAGHLVSEDFIHEGPLVTVLVIVLDRDLGDSGLRQLLAATLDIVRYRYPGERDEWVHIGGEDSVGMDISVESARRLAEVLARSASLPEV